MEKIIRERRRILEKAYTEARLFAECVYRLIGPVRVIIYGSYARGDFNAWSDIDVLVVSCRELPYNPVERLDLIDECLIKYSSIEPVVISCREFLSRRRNPIIQEAVKEGVTVFDRLNECRCEEYC